MGLKQKKISRPSRNKSAKKKYVFFSIMIAIPIVIILSLEFLLTLTDYGTNYKLFVPTPTSESPFIGIDYNATKKYFTELTNFPTPRKDLFLKEKPENTFRIFVIGGSTAAGFPYGNNLTFSRILNRRLADVFPDKRIEVVNTAFSAINTYTQLDFMDEIMENHPDAILIYSGHNEYYGALGVGSMESLGKYPLIIKTILSLKNFKIYQLLENTIKSIAASINSSDKDPKSLNSNATMMESIVAKKTIPYNSEDYRLGIEQFENNMDEILRIVTDKNIPVIISELVSNVGDQKPFNSVKNGEYPLASNIYKKAKAAEENNDIELANKYYYQAKDLDALRFRAPEEINNVIHKLAIKYKTPIVPLKSYFESNSLSNIIGEELMLEHLHPNKNGYFLIADAFFNTMQNEKLISDDWKVENIKPSSYYSDNWGFTEIDSVYASLSISQLKGGWPFKRIGTHNAFLDYYKPSTIVDSTVFQIFTNKEITLEKAHIQLAKYYETKGEFDLAINEYKALIYTVPYFDIFYEPAINLLLYQKNYSEALRWLIELSKHQESNFTNKWIGQIYLVMNEPKKAIPYLENLVTKNQNDEIIVHNLCRAYYNIAEIQKGDAIFNLLKNKFPKSDYLISLKRLREKTITSNI